VPNVKGNSPKYSAYAFTDDEWDTLALALEVLAVCNILLRMYSALILIKAHTLQEAALVQDEFASEMEPTMYRMISSFDFFCSRWEGFAAAPKFAQIKEAIQCGIDLLVKYYCLSDRSVASIVCLSKLMSTYYILKYSA
jgi:hypothetical protein